MNTGEKVGIVMIVVGLLTAVFPVGIFRAIQTGRIVPSESVGASFFGMMVMFLGLALIGFGLAVKIRYARKR